MDRDKLAQLRKKKAERKEEQRVELVASNTSIKDAILELHQAINGIKPFDAKQIIDQINDLKLSLSFTEDIKKLEAALSKVNKDPLKIENFDKLLSASDNSEIVASVKSLIVTLEDQTVSQDPKDYQPVRRVRKVGTRLVFDDDAMQVNVSGGGGGGGTVIPLIDGAVPVVNPDGSTISGGGSGGLTDTQLRASPVTVDTGLTIPTPQTDALTNTQLRAMPVETTTAELITQFYEDVTYTYICKAAIGTALSSASWQIKRLDSSGSKRYAGGNGSFTNTATNLTTVQGYTYS